MENYEIKKFGILSLFKTALYLMAVPAILVIIIGIIIILAGIATGETTLILVGAAFTLIYPLLFTVVYGAFGSLAGLVYNLLAGRFGGLELTLVKKDDEVIHGRTFKAEN